MQNGASINKDEAGEEMLTGYLCEVLYCQSKYSSVGFIYMMYWRNIEPCHYVIYGERGWGGLYQSNVGCFYKVQYVLCRYTAAQLPRISAPWTASPPHFSTVDSARSLCTD